MSIGSTMATVLMGAFALSWIGTGLMRRYAVARSIIDRPNPRSLHEVPTPRGGGVAMVVVVLGGTMLLGLWDFVSADVTLAVAGGIVAVGAIGWMDDRRGVRSSVRAAIHFMAAAWALYWLEGLPGVRVADFDLSLGVLGTGVAAVGIVWCTNLYNFMDGVDGIAGAEAASVGLFGGGFLLLAGEPALGALAILVAGAACGFLPWNWAPAKIFMGDVGSGVLGYVFAVLAVASERADAVPVLIWGLLAGVFVFDATVTLIRRVLRGERWYEPHRGHAYQRAVQRGWTHARVVIVVLVVNIGLGGLAAVGQMWPLLIAPVFVVGGLLLWWLYRRVDRIGSPPTTSGSMA